jgi:hypothetical protein
MFQIKHSRRVTRIKYCDEGTSNGKGVDEILPELSIDDYLIVAWNDNIIQAKLLGTVLIHYLVTMARVYAGVSKNIFVELLESMESICTMKKELISRVRIADQIVDFSQNVCAVWLQMIIFLVIYHDYDVSFPIIILLQEQCLQFRYIFVRA